MADATLHGLLVPLVTPLEADGALAVSAVERLAHEVLDAGADGVVALGTTAEAATLTASERRTVLRVCAQVCWERGAALVVGSGGNDTASSADGLVELAEHGPIRAALVPVPYYTRPGERGVVAHFRALAARSPIPLLVYNIPYRTGQLLSLTTLHELAELDGVVGVKQAVGGLDATTAELLADPPPGFAVLAGDDAAAPGMLALGAAGAIAATANVCPSEFAELTRAWRSGQVERARRLGNRLTRIGAALFAEPNPTVIKGVLHAQGRIPSAAVRLPLLPASPEAVSTALRACETRTVCTPRVPVG